jgi:hypothetical protein
MALQPEHVTVLLYYDDPELRQAIPALQPPFFVIPSQSFYVPPRLLPELNVTLRLVEDGPPEAVRLYLGGFCFDVNSSDYLKGRQLPRWVQIEAGSDYIGPLEADKAQAARKLALTFAAYWIDSVSTAKPEAAAPGDQAAH